MLSIISSYHNNHRVSGEIQTHVPIIISHARGCNGSTRGASQVITDLMLQVQGT